jgi:hypothetical protein
MLHSIATCWRSACCKRCCACYKSIREATATGIYSSKAARRALPRWQTIVASCVQASTHIGQHVQAGYRCKEPKQAPTTPPRRSGPSPRHTKVFDGPESFSTQLQSKLKELHSGFETSMHVVHAFRNPEVPSQSSELQQELQRSTARLRSDAVEPGTSVQSDGSASGRAQLKRSSEAEKPPTQSTRSLRGISTDKASTTSLHGGPVDETESYQKHEYGDAGDSVATGCAKKPVRLKAKGWHVEADACTGMGRPSIHMPDNSYSCVSMTVRKTPGFVPQLRLRTAV